MMKKYRGKILMLIDYFDRQFLQEAYQLSIKIFLFFPHPNLNTYVFSSSLKF